MQNNRDSHWANWLNYRLDIYLKNKDRKKLNHQLNICLWILVPIVIVLIGVLIYLYQ